MDEQIDPATYNPEIKEEKTVVMTEHKLRSIIAGSLAAGLLGGFLGVFILNASSDGNNGLLSQQRVLVEENSAIVDVVDKTQPAIVSVVGSKQVSTGTDFSDLFPFFPQTPDNNQEQQVSSGTGFFVSSDGLIATNKHVVADRSAKYQVLTNDGKRHDAKIAAIDPSNDIALMKIEGSGFPVLELGDSESIKVGQRVVAIGNALGQYSNTVTSGVISGINRSVVASGDLTEISQIEGAIQTDAAINPGNSGGPLLDLSGKVIGINTAVSSQGQLIGFAIPVNDLRKDIEIFGQRSVIVKPLLGVRYITITHSLAQERKLGIERGALVYSGSANEPAVIPGSAAEKAGIREGDVITKVGDRQIDLEHSLAAVVRNYNPGETVTVEVFRDGGTISLQLTFGERTE